jgi:cell division protein FtsB
VLVVLFIFVLILAFFFGEGGIIEIISARTKIEELRKNITELEKEKDALIKEIEELKKNPMALEKKAREKLWLMKKNEKVVVIVKNNDKDSEKKEK